MVCPPCLSTMQSVGTDSIQQVRPRDSLPTHQRMAFSRAEVVECPRHVVIAFHSRLPTARAPWCADRHVGQEVSHACRGQAPDHGHGNQIREKGSSRSQHLGRWVWATPVPGHQGPLRVHLIPCQRLLALNFSRVLLSEA